MTAVAGLLAALFCALATWLLILLAPRVGLVDDARDAPDRKSHARAVPLVGGLAIAAAVVGAWSCSEPFFGRSFLGGEVVPGVSFRSGSVLLALALALATGLCDDLAPRGLSPLAKLLGQTAAGLALSGGLVLADAAAGGGELAHLWPRVLCVVAAVAAQNAANTFDNADGALVTVAGVGFLGAPIPLGATLAFLPFNLLRRKGSATPFAWLGDSGAHFLGILLLSTPVAWAALVLPSLDLLRVCVLRLRAGVPVWRGDRRHLAHALAARGLAPAAVALLLALLAAPFVAAAWFFARS
jgi:UDP-N-acetylmuramyl pentapeptide phosphotransferase/UDP-N-acetylglucosamine-1-phosphate transferase